MRAVVEAVESRRYCIADTFATAIDLGPLTGNQEGQGTVAASGDTVDFIKFTMPQAGGLRVAVVGVTGNVNLALYNAPNAAGLIGSATNGGLTPDVVQRASVPAGTYYVKVSGTGAATSYVRTFTSEFAGNNPGSARNIGGLTTTARAFKDYVGNLDNDDFYKFSTTTAGNVTVRLEGLGANADLFLYDAAGTTFVAQSVLAGTSADQVVKSLPAGTYTARVKRIGTAQTNYTVKFTGPAAASDPGGTIATAKDLGTIGVGGNSTLTATNSVNKTTDTVDFYKVNTVANGLLTVRVTNLVNGTPSTGFSNVSVALYSSGGTLLDTIGPSTSAGDNVMFRGVGTGSYFIKVFGSTAATTSYSLSVSNPPIPADTGGNTRATATAVTASNFPNAATKRGYVINQFDQDDWYKVTYEAGTVAQVILKGMTGNIRFTAHDSTGAEIARSAADPDFQEVGFFAPTTGTYYIHVFQGVVGANGSASAYYFLSV